MAEHQLTNNAQIGGSISGLLQALQLKRMGASVLILEQDPSHTRGTSHDSGVTIGPSVIAMLRKYDATAGTPSVIPAEFLSVALRQHPRVFSTAWRHNTSNWGCLYSVLRANVDGLVSHVVPVPPEKREGDGQAVYRPGRRVVGIEYDQAQGAVSVLHVDSGRGSRGHSKHRKATEAAEMEVERVSAEMVIAADGVHSTIRRLMGIPTHWKYAGYIAWRGTVSEDRLSPETVRYFSDRLTFSLLGGTYLITYIIPSQHGSVDPGTRRLNWVWYYPAAEGSAEMNAIFTDLNGALQPHTVPPHLLNPAVWSAHRRRYIPEQTTAAVAELVIETSQPYVTKVGESDAHPSTFFDNRLVLVGDAFSGFRSHMGLASEQAARHCFQMERVWRGEMTQAARDREAILYARRLLLLNRLVGFLGMEWWWAEIRTVLAYLWLMMICRFM
jgi:2-polyprenyl-6-methoxyphenol hydroxylase-like FAD-dependent oxidoreductase